MTWKDDLTRCVNREIGDRLQSSASTDAGSQKDSAGTGYSIGPWFVGPHYSCDVESRDGRICECKPFNSPRAAANARCIAALPELLTALKQMVELYEPHPHSGEPWVATAARAAIARAEGR